ncbi:hypothetical protein SADUNF_Sadunf16G0294900 [Salix dunnii]|uniref:Uncharacterized protein n=1 Tax=Salix dunnii TaxID=1413687 RepID=A0A835MHW4_9ROSI|nr:hypothetical protein SADUNF_Sadunf16G0294900 [Salix dunnii]
MTDQCFLKSITNNKNPSVKTIIKTPNHRITFHIKTPNHNPVIYNSGRERSSIVSFCFPLNDTKIGPLKKLIDDEHPTIYKDFTNEKFYSDIWKGSLDDSRLEQFKA